MCVSALTGEQRIYVCVGRPHGNRPVHRVTLTDDQFACTGHASCPRDRSTRPMMRVGTINQQRDRCSRLSPIAGLGGSQRGADFGTMLAKHMLQSRTLAASWVPIFDVAGARGKRGSTNSWPRLSIESNRKRDAAVYQCESRRTSW